MDDQAGLCLSCGVPFLPDLSKIEFFNRNAVLSVVFLQSEFLNNPEIRQLYNVPKFSDRKHAAHMFHESHHGTALQYMCNRHTDDNDVGAGFVVAANAVVPNANNAPFLYFRSPTSADKDPGGATWTRPPRNMRFKLSKLKTYIRNSLRPAFRPIQQNLDQTFDACVGCNSVMTQLADFRYIVGYRTVSNRNPNSILSQMGQPIAQITMQTNRAPLANAYGTWAVAPNIVRNLHPAKNESDADATHVAYFLHLCLPFQAGGVNFFTRLSPVWAQACRTFYLEQCWLVLEIACIATLLEQGKVTSDNERLSHGLHQHYGVLDLYVSFFMFRLIQFRHFTRLRQTGVNFIQWHQKYYCEAMNCRDLFPRRSNLTTVLGQKMYSTTEQGSRELIEQICRRMVMAVEGVAQPLVRHILGLQNVPHGITEYFVPTEVLRVLVRRSRQVRTRNRRAKRFIHSHQQHFGRSCPPTSRRRWASSGSTRSCTGSSGCARTTPRSSRTSSWTSAPTGRWSRSIGCRRAASRCPRPTTCTSCA
jgi:hypothetical protein